MSGPGYMIIGIDIHDPSMLEAYSAETMPILDRYGGELLAATDEIVHRDGDWGRKRIVILKFPSVKAAKSFWESPDYVPLKQLREASSDQDNILVEGFEGIPDIDGTPAYMVIGMDVHDGDAIAEYAKKMGEFGPQFGVTPLAASEKFEALDGAWNRERIALLRFPSAEEFNRMWTHPDYQPLKELREGASKGDHVVIKGA
ncbi:MAG: DUF1330 domain-containing protein [Alphaproteobacteria bacterium]|nr:DUF1330 domain-containing protein [Alphaproteobacteria bacterium]